MVNIRIIEIPKMKAVYSGPLTDAERFTAFNKWFSEYHASLKMRAVSPRFYVV